MVAYREGPHACPLDKPMLLNQLPACEHRHCDEESEGVTAAKGRDPTVTAAHIEVVSMKADLLHIIDQGVRTSRSRIELIWCTSRITCHSDADWDHAIWCCSHSLGQKPRSSLASTAATSLPS